MDKIIQEAVSLNGRILTDDSVKPNLEQRPHINKNIGTTQETRNMVLTVSYKELPRRVPSLSRLATV
jgi:hypothetical protein